MESHIIFSTICGKSKGFLGSTINKKNMFFLKVQSDYVGLSGLIVGFRFYSIKFCLYD